MSNRIISARTIDPVVQLRNLLSATPPEELADRMLRLLPREVLETLLLGDAIRKTVTARLTETNPFSFASIAQEYGVKAALIRDIYRRMRDESPCPLPVQPQNRLKDIDDPEKRDLLAKRPRPSFNVPRNAVGLALPKETRALNIVEEMLLAAKFVIQIRNKRDSRGELIDLTDELPPLPLQIQRGADIVRQMMQGTVHYALLGSDRIDEITYATPWRDLPPPYEYSSLYRVWGKYRENSFRLCMAVPMKEAEKAIQSGPSFFMGKTIATSYPHLFEIEFGRKFGIYANLTMRGGGVEESIGKSGVFAIMDIVETGNSLREHGLAPVWEVRQENFRLFSLSRLAPPSSDDATDPDKDPNNYCIARLCSRLRHTDTPNP